MLSGQFGDCISHVHSFACNCNGLIRPHRTDGHPKIRYCTWWKISVSAFPTAFPDHKSLATCISRCTLSGSRELSFRATTVHNQEKRLPLTVRRKRAQVFQNPLIRWFIRLSLSLSGEEMGRVKGLICEIAVPAVMKVVATTTRVKEHGLIWARGNRQHLGTALWWDHKGGTSAWVIVRPFS